MIDFRNVDQWNIGNDEVKKAWLNGTLVWEKRDKTEPFYVENITDSVEHLRIGKNENDAPNITIEVSSDKTNWTTLGTTSTRLSPLYRDIQPGEKLYIRAKTNRWAIRNQMVFYWNSIGGVSKVGGNIMSLLYGSDFTGNETSFKGYGYEFAYLFNTGFVSQIIDASSLILPAVSDGCYMEMFAGSPITSAPILSATTLAPNCYSYMFYGCSSLNYVYCFATDISASGCVDNWLYNVAANGTFIKNPNMSSWPAGDSGIPSGWTVIDA